MRHTKALRRLTTISCCHPAEFWASMTIFGRLYLELDTGGPSPSVKILQVVEWSSMSNHAVVILNFKFKKVHRTGNPLELVRELLYQAQQ